jgi:hypothetical protein
MVFSPSRIADEDAGEPFRHALFLDREAAPCHLGLCGGDVRHQKTDVALAPWRRLGIHSDMHLQAAHLEPCTAAAAQFLGLGNLRKAEHPPIKGEARRFQRLWNGNLDVIDSGNRKRHTRSPRPCLRLPARRPGC